MAGPLDQELATYDQRREELLKNHENQFVLIKGNQVLGQFTTEEEAYQAGVEHFGDQPFLIKQVLKEEPIARIPTLTLGLL